MTVTARYAHNLSFRLKRLLSSAPAGPFIFLLLIFTPVLSSAAEITLEWDAVRDVAEYRLYRRAASEPYDYSVPYWQGRDTRCVVSGLRDDTVYYFVVRAVDENENESGDSNEAVFDPRMDRPSSGAAPEPVDPVPESPYQPMPPSDDVDGIIDDDANPSESGPDVPRIDTSGDEGQPVPLHVELCTNTFNDTDPEACHHYTRWLIFRDADDRCIFDRTSRQQLTRLTVPPLLLDGGTRYYWTVQHYDRAGGISLPAENAYFTTVPWSEDTILPNGIPDSYELTSPTDLDRNRVPDEDQIDMKCCFAIEGNQMVAVKVTTGWPEDRLQAVQPIDAATLTVPEGPQPEFPYGLVNFKVLLDPAAVSAMVTIYFSEPVEDSLYWLIYDPMWGYADYSQNTTISTDRRTVTLRIEDGNAGDMDGAANGIVVATAGYATGEPAAEAANSPYSSNLSGNGGDAQTSDGWLWIPSVSCFIEHLLP